MKGFTQGFNFQTSVLTPSKPFADENELLSKSPPEVQNAILDIYEISQKYSHNNTISESESIQKSLTNLHETIHSKFFPTLFHLAEEIDYGNDFIQENHLPLNTYQAVYNASSSSANSKFLSMYFDKLVHRYNSLNQSIKNLETHITDQFNHPPNHNCSDILLLVLKQQNDAILRCSSRLYAINERSRQLEDRLKAQTSYSFTFHGKNRSANSQNSEETVVLSNSFKKGIQEAIRKHKENRIMELEKRYTNPEFFRPKPAAAGGLGAGFKFGSVPTNFGKNNQTTASFGATNQSQPKSFNQAITSTPTSFKGQNDLTPTKTSATGAGYSGLGGGAGGVTPTAPKKGGSSSIISSPPRS